MTKKISFIIPAHNEEKYIGNCIESIFKEADHYDYPFEIIVVDNGSTDDTEKEVLKAGAHLYIREEKAGISNAKLAGIKATTRFSPLKNKSFDPDYIAFIDADGRMPRGWIDIAIDTFYESDDVVAVSGSLQFYDGPDYLNKWSKHFYKAAKVLHQKYPTMQGGNYIVKKEALDKCNAFDPDIKFWGEDTHTAVELSKVGRIILNPNLVMYTSARRFLQDGIIKTTINYTTNYFAVNLLDHPLNKEFKNFR